jgi:3-phenylpropionate/trans-cinnamate dioxygenase ferredoxin reductase subunit
VFAAGDVAVAPNPWAGRRIRLESWQNAQYQAIAAAKAALGQDVTYEPLPSFWSDQYDVKLQIFGVPSPSHQVVMRREAGSATFVAFCLEGDVVNAALAANAPRDLRVARKLIEQRTRVTAADLADTTRPLAALA